jgi:site-specific DNA recombinase
VTGRSSLLAGRALGRLRDLCEKTWRGQLGRALQGRIPGGRAYGYAVVETDGANAERGRRRLNEAEAAVVRRIFTEFAAGMSPRAIAKRLNAAGVPGPDGRAWRDTTIRGQVERGTGLLNNALYVGRLEWNRCAYVKDPRTGKRVARPNPPERWEVVAVSELRIVDDDLWAAVKARQAAQLRRWPGRRRQRPQPGPPPPLPALRAARLRAVRRRLHDHRQGALRLRRARVG